MSFMRPGPDQKAQNEEEAKRRFAEAEAWRKYYYKKLDFVFVPMPGTVPKDDATAMIGTYEDRYYGEGLYQMQRKDAAGEIIKAPFTIAVDANGNAFPIPRCTDKNDEKFREAYSKTIDFIARGFSKIEIEWPWPSPGLLPHEGLTVEKLETLCELAEQKGLAIEFGPSVTRFLHTLPPEELQRFMEMRTALEEKRQQTLLLANVDKSPLVSATTKLTGKDRVGNAATIKTRLLEHPPGTQKPQEEKLKSIEDEMKNATERLDQLKKSAQTLQGYLNSSTSLLNDPASLQKDRVASGGMHMGYWKRKWAVKAKNERERLAQDPTRVVDMVGESLTSTEAQRTALLAEMNAECAYLEKKITGCQQAITQMRADATGTPASAPGVAPVVVAVDPAHPLDPAQEARLKALEDKSKTLYEAPVAPVAVAPAVPAKGELATVKTAVDAVVAQNPTLTAAQVTAARDRELARQRAEGRINVK